MSFTYEAVFDLWRAWESEVFINGMLIGLQIIAACFFMLNVFTEVINNITKTDIKPTLPFDMNKVVFSLVFVFLLFAYVPFLDLLDSILLEFDGIYHNYEPEVYNPAEDEIDEMDADMDWTEILSQFAHKALWVIKVPSSIIIGILSGLAWIIDGMVTFVFLLERFFFLTIAKILGSVAITCAVFERYRDIFFTWLKVYIGLYLLIIPFFLIMSISSFAYEYVTNQYGVGTGVSGFLVDYSAGHTIRIMVICMGIWLKLRLYKKSYEIVHKIFA